MKKKRVKLPLTQKDRIITLEKETFFLLNHRDKQEKRLLELEKREKRLLKLESWMRSNLGYIGELDIEKFPLPEPLTPIPFQYSDSVGIMEAIPFSLDVIKTELGDEENKEMECVDIATPSPKKSHVERVQSQIDSFPQAHQILSNNGLLEVRESSLLSTAKKLGGDKVATTRSNSKQPPAAMEMEKQFKKLKDVILTKNEQIIESQGTSSTFKTTDVNAQRLKEMRIPKLTIKLSPNTTLPAPEPVPTWSIQSLPSSYPRESILIQPRPRQFRREKTRNLNCNRCLRRFKTDSSLRQHLDDTGHGSKSKLKLKQARTFVERKNKRQNLQRQNPPNPPPQAQSQQFESFIFSPEASTPPQPQNHVLNQNPTQNPMSPRYLVRSHSINKISTAHAHENENPSTSKVPHKMISGLRNSGQQQQTEWKIPTVFNSNPVSVATADQRNKNAHLHSCPVCKKSFSLELHMIQHHRTHSVQTSGSGSVRQPVVSILKTGPKTVAAI